MRNYLLFFNQCFAITVVILIIVSCNRNFDEAPLITADPNVTVTMKIMDLKTRYKAVGDFQRIEDDQTISGVVIADDRSGSFYKQVIIQDETGGLPVMLDVNDAYTQYPVGRRVFIKIKGLMLGDYGGTIELGLDSSKDGQYLDLVGIPQAMFDQYIVKGSFNNTIAPQVVKPSAFTRKINDPLMSTLIQIDSMEFAVSDTAKTYADPAKLVSAVNFTIGNCNGQSILLRNSSYAKFAASGVADGNGTITGIVNIFNGATQMSIRDTSDIQFTGIRCSQQPAVPITLPALKTLYTSDRVIDKNYIVDGIITSDFANENNPPNTFILQSNNRAIAIYYGSVTMPYNPGDSISLNISPKDSLIRYRGSLELKLNKNFIMSPALATGKTIIPVEKTIAEINATLNLPLSDPDNFEYSLVKVKSAMASSGTFNGSKELTDGSGTIQLFTNSSATFASSQLPLNTPDWVVYPYNFNNTKEVSIRNLSDITGGIFTPPSTGGGIDLGTVSPYTQNFNFIGSGLPTGVKVVTGARIDAIGSNAAFINTISSSTVWKNTGSGFKNFASGTGLTVAADSLSQQKSTNRAIGIRQIGGNGYDPGAGFIFIINNTTGKSNLKLDFILQSLDGISSAGRTTTWIVDYGIGENPATFTPITTTPATLTTSLGTFNTTMVHADLPAALNNNESKIWLRIVTLSASINGGSRASSAIDDFKISW